MKYTACSFTGHRQIADGAIPALRVMLARAIKYIYDNGCTDFYTGGALGFDTMAANAVLDFRASHPEVRLHLVLPCFDQARSWSRRDRAEYERILSEADSAEYISTLYYDGCMRDRNERLITHSDVLVAYLGRAYGGSMQTVTMAKMKGIDIFNLYGKSPQD